MPDWPIHPALGAAPDALSLTRGDDVQLPQPQSPLHAAWLRAAQMLREAPPVPLPLEDAPRLERALRAEVGGLGAARIVGVYGAAGSGRTSVLLGLAKAFGRRGDRVALLDADLAAPSLRRRLGGEDPPIVVEGLVLPYVVADMRMQGIDAFWPLPGSLPWHGGELRRVLERFREDVLWAQPDVLLVDMPPLGDPRLGEVAACFDGTFVHVMGPFETAVEGPRAACTVRNAARGVGDALLPYVEAGDLSETFSTRLFDLTSRLGEKGSSSSS